jgi:hypothetical protein
VLAFGLAFRFSASRMMRLHQGYGGTGNTGTRSGEYLEKNPKPAKLEA